MTARVSANTSSTSGSQLSPGFINVKTDFGATGNGSTDDYAALNNAVTYIKSNGGVMYFPAGTYKCSGTLNFIGATKSFSLRGPQCGKYYLGQQARLVYSGTTTGGTGGLLCLNGCSGWEIAYLGLDYSNASFTGDLVNVDGRTGVFQDCQDFHIHHCGSRATTSITARSIIRLAAAIIGTIDYCHFTGAINPIRVGDPGGYFVVAVQIDKCTFNFAKDSDAGQAMILLATTDGEAIQVRDNTFEAGTNTPGIRGATVALDGSGVALYSPVVSGNWFGDAVSDLVWVKDLAVTSNNFMGVLGPGNRFASPGSGAGTCFKGTGYWLVIGNTFDGGKALDSSATLHPVAIGNFFNGTVNWLPLDAGIGNISTDSALPANYNSTFARFAVTGDTGADLQAQITNEELVIGTSGSRIAQGTAGAVYRIKSGGNPFATVVQAPASPSATDREVQLCAGSTPSPIIRIHSGGVGFNGTAPLNKPTITGSRGGNVALADLLTKLASMGLLTDSSS